MLYGFSWLIMKFNRWLSRAGWKTSGFKKTMCFLMDCEVVLKFSCDLFYDYVIIQRWMLERWMNDGTRRDLERSGRNRIQACLEGLRTIRIAGIPGNVRTAHLPNRTPEYYHDSKLLGPLLLKKTLHHEIGFVRLIQIIPHSIAQCKI
jgi:hypothetical protein